MFKFGHRVTLSKTHFSAIISSTQEKDHVVIKFFKDLTVSLGFLRHDFIGYSELRKRYIAFGDSATKESTALNFETQRIEMNYFRVLSFELL